MTPTNDAPAPAPSGVRVKPLDWAPDGVIAETPFGTYSVGPDVDDAWTWTRSEYPYGESSDPLPTESEAKAAAQADYEARILSALASDDSPRGEAVAWPLRARVWQRMSTNEWVLEIEGVINETHMTCRHTEPLTTAIEDVPGLPSLYAHPAPATVAMDWNHRPDLGAMNGSPEPSLRQILWSYYGAHFSTAESRRLTEAYIAALAPATEGRKS